MLERRGFRFALEIVFLALLASALTVASLRPLAIAGLMLLGWVIVALFEWVTWRAEAHYGRGLPPRYYVPQLSLPDPVPVEQEWIGYPAPAHRDEAPTWIASPATQADVLADWPSAPAFDPLMFVTQPAPEQDPPADDIRLERHRIDPLRDDRRGRAARRRRTAPDDPEVTTVPARPNGLRTLPVRRPRED